MSFAVQYRPEILAVFPVKGVVRLFYPGKFLSRPKIWVELDGREAIETSKAMTRLVKPTDHRKVIISPKICISLPSKHPGFDVGEEVILVFGFNGIVRRAAPNLDVVVKDIRKL